jgi:hypothetical protein
MIKIQSEAKWLDDAQGVCLLGTALLSPRLLTSGIDGLPVSFRKSETAKRHQCACCSSWLNIHIDICVASSVVFLHSVLTRRRENKVYSRTDVFCGIRAIGYRSLARNSPLGMRMIPQ